MKFIKNHLGLILPMFAILFSLEYLLVFDRIVDLYEQKLKNQYTIITVAEATTGKESIRQASKLIESVERIDPGSVLKKIEKRMSKKQFDALKEILPAFYSIKLKRYPDKSQLESLKKDLKRVLGVKEIHLFKKVHDNQYEMLLFLKRNFYIFAALIGLTGLLLIMKQLQIWQLEHQERMRIMSLFGAPLWLRSGVFFRMTFVDTLLAIMAVTGLMIYLYMNPIVGGLMSEMGIQRSMLIDFRDLGWLALTGFVVSFVTVLWVVIRFKEDV